MLLKNGVARVCAVAGGINGALAIAAAAYGRHQVADEYSREILSIAASYQLGHAIALIGVACLAELSEASWASPAGVAAACFATGTALFCGALYILGIGGLLVIEGAAPVGGLLLIFGWLALTFIGLRRVGARRDR